MTPFSTLIASLSADADDYCVNPSDDWRQGRTLFGGLSAALCFAACERAVPDLPPLRAGQIAFVGPSAGESRLVPRIIRRGKSVTFMSCDLIAEGAVATRALFVFGGARPSSLRDVAPRAPIVPRPEECAPLFGERRPTFTQHLDQRFAGGHRPVTGADKGEMFVWVRHIDQQPTSAMAALVALGDALPPASMPRLTEPAPISTMTWSFDLMAPERVIHGGWYLLHSRDDAVGDGYSGQAMAMWDESGAPVLIGRQSVAVFA
jgi:acyl-CoA thioesterase